METVKHYASSKSFWGAIVTLIACFLMMSSFRWVDMQSMVGLAAAGALISLIGTLLRDSRLGHPPPAPKAPKRALYETPIERVEPEAFVEPHRLEETWTPAETPAPSGLESPAPQKTH